MKINSEINELTKKCIDEVMEVITKWKKLLPYYEKASDFGDILTNKKLLDFLLVIKRFSIIDIQEFLRISKHEAKCVVQSLLKLDFIHIYSTQYKVNEKAVTARINELSKGDDGIPEKKDMYDDDDDERKVEDEDEKRKKTKKTKKKTKKSGIITIADKLGIK